MRRKNIPEQPMRSEYSNSFLARPPIRSSKRLFCMTRRTYSGIKVELDVSYTRRVLKLLRKEQRIKTITKNETHTI